MPRNDDGEFELVLGNRQLLSVFFIVVILLGVFFTMGWIVGRNSMPSSTEVARHTDGPTSIVVDPRGSPDQPSTAAAPPRMEPAPQETAKPAPVVERPKPTAHVEPAKPEVEKPERTAPAPPSPSTPSPSTPPSGQYLQVSAVGKPEAELMVDVLNKKGFHALAMQVPNSALYRVLVGPLADASTISKTRTELQNAGLKGYDALVRKY